MTKELLGILLTAILTENFVLAKFLGICPFLGVSKKLNTAVGMSAAVIFVMALATAVTYPINLLLVKKDLAYLQTIVFILVIAALVQLVEIILKKYIDQLRRAGRGAAERPKGLSLCTVHVQLRRRGRRLYAGHDHVCRRA